MVRDDVDHLGEDVGSPQRGKEGVSCEGVVESVEVKGAGVRLVPLRHGQFHLLHQFFGHGYIRGSCPLHGDYEIKTVG